VLMVEAFRKEALLAWLRQRDHPVLQSIIGADVLGTVPTEENILAWLMGSDDYDTPSLYSLVVPGTFPAFREAQYLVCKDPWEVYRFRCSFGPLSLYVMRPSSNLPPSSISKNNK
jgi:hypothetical protein